MTPNRLYVTSTIIYSLQDRLDAAVAEAKIAGDNVAEVSTSLINAAKMAVAPFVADGYNVSLTIREKTKVGNKVRVPRADITITWDTL